MGTPDASDQTQHRAICASIGHAIAGLSLDGVRVVDLVVDLVRRHEMDHGPIALAPAGGAVEPFELAVVLEYLVALDRQRARLRAAAAAELAAAMTAGPAR